MKRTIAVLLALLMLLTLLMACGKKTVPQNEGNTDPNAVLTDSDVPLDVGVVVEGTGGKANDGAPVVAEGD